MKVIHSINFLCKQLLIIFMYIIPLTILVQVISRSLFNYSFTGAEELARILLVWATFIGANVAFCEKAMPAFDLLDRKLSDKKRIYLNTTIQFFICIFTIVATITGFLLLQQPIIVQQESAGLGIPMYLAYAAVPVGMLFITINCIAFFINITMRRFKDQTVKNDETDQQAL